MSKKHSTITVTSVPCLVLEQVRFALEVLFGARIRFKHYEINSAFRTGSGAFYMNDEEHQLSMFSRKDHGNWSLLDLAVDDTLYVARVSHDKTEARVINGSVLGQRNWIVGTSDTNRWEEPLQ